MTARRALGARLAAVAIAATLVLTGCGPQPEPQPTPSPTPPTTTSAAPRATPSPTPVDPLPDGAVTALVLGTDSRTPGTFDGNADTIIVAQISADRETLALVSITRDSWVEVPGLGTAKINAAFETGGTERMRETVSALFGGLEIDYVVQTDFSGFIGVADALGGFPVENEHSSQAPDERGRTATFPAGEITVEGPASLAYVRQRSGLPEGDLDRAERGRAALIGMLERIDQLAAEPARLPGLMDGIASNVRLTGALSVDDLVALAAVSVQLEQGDILSVMAPLEGFGWRGDQYVNVVDDERTAELGDALRAGEVRAYVDQHGTDYVP